MEKLIITVAATGNVPTQAMNSHLPVTPDEIAETAVRCRAAGAGLIHVHARDAEGRPTLDPEVFARIHRLVGEPPEIAEAQVVMAVLGGVVMYRR